jgi:hypothetical protein
MLSYIHSHCSVISSDHLWSDSGVKHQLDQTINGSKPMQNYQEYFLSDIFLKFCNIIKIIIENYKHYKHHKNYIVLNL